MNPLPDPSSSISAGASSAYLKAILDGDRWQAFGVIDRAREVGIDVRSIYLDIFRPALWEIGRLWQENKISVADEHLATAITQAAMARLFEQEFTWSPDRPRTLVAACVDTERHEVGLRMLCDLLEIEGWDTTYLGATVPVESLVEMILKRRPDVIALSTAIAPHLPRLRESIAAVRAATGDDPPLIIAGGRPFLEDPKLAEILGADLTASDPVEAARVLDERVSAS